MLSALTYVGCSITVLALLILLYTIEDIRGKRLFLDGFRQWLDRVCAFILSKLSQLLNFFGMKFVRLLIHYSLHGLLKRILGGLRKLEKKVEELVRKNRKIATEIQLSKTKNHLDAIAEHKEETALSEKQKEKLLSQ